MTWAIFELWYLDKFVEPLHFELAFGFAAIYFLTFYITFIGYKFRSSQNAAVENVSLILANSFIFYGIGYTLFDRHPAFHGYLGLFTVANAGIHLTFGLIAARIKTVSSDFIYLLGALVLTFITITVPVQFDIQIVTLVWTAEAAILFWIGRTKVIELYEYFSYPLMILASLSLLGNFGNWLSVNEQVLATATQFPFFHSFFISSLFYVAAFALIYLINRDGGYAPAGNEGNRTLIKYFAVTAATIVFYNAFRGQINDYFDFLRFKTAVGLEVNSYGVSATAMDGDLTRFSALWQINYTMLFLTVMAAMNIKRFKNTVLAVVNIALSCFLLLIFITFGLLLLSELRDSYLNLQDTSDYVFNHTIFHILIRYISYVFVAGIFVSLYQYSKQPLLLANSDPKHNRFLFEMLLTVSLFFILSSELLNCMDIFGMKDSYKLGLSIFWGVYALILVSVGISLGRKHLRVSAIVLFAITLAKLVLYDIANLNTLSKTAVFVSLGLLMLIVSFLYHKYKAIIFKADIDDQITEK